MAKNGQEALQIYRTLKNKPDLIIMDYNLPIKDGLSTTTELTKIDKDLKIIMISGDASIKNKALLAGALSFIQKPFDIQFFIHKISQYYCEELKT